MKKGVNTLDALIAILLILFIMSWIQNFTTMNLNQANNFGGEIQAKTSAMYVGSQMNSFYATNPGQEDYIDLSKTLPDINIFGIEEVVTTITKNIEDNKVVFQISTESTYSSDYPVIKELTYVDGKVRLV